MTSLHPRQGKIKVKNLNSKYLIFPTPYQHNLKLTIKGWFIKMVNTYSDVKFSALFELGAKFFENK